MPNSTRPKEKIDERILRLIGLEDVFDLDYDTYRLLIKEVLVKNSIGKIRIPDEERDLMIAEIKRIRTNEGRFEVKKKKINASSFGLKKTTAKITKKMLPAIKLNALPQEVEQKQTSSFAGLLEKDVLIIRASIESIYESISLQQKFLAKQTEQERKEQENAKRSAKESQLEKRFSILKKVADRLLAPVKSILSQILDFFIKMILGRTLMKLIDWMADPQNKGKIDSIFKFLKTFWPALLAAYILFGTRLGSFAGSIIASVGKFLIRLTRVAIPGLLRFIANNRLGFAVTALLGAGAAAELVPGMTGQKEEETQRAPGTTEDKLSALKEQRRNLNWFEQLQGRGSEIDEQIKYLETGTEKSYGFSGGGGGYGLVRGKKGVDQINARLSDGEFVMAPGAVKLWGVDTLARMNAAGGGTNKPKIYGGKTYAAGGGLIGRTSPGHARSGNNDIQNIKNFIKYQIGFDVDRPYTWGKSFSSGMSGMSGGYRGSAPNININSGISGLVNQAQGLVKDSKDPRSYSDLLNQTGTRLLNAGQLETTKALNSIEKLQLGKKYQDMSNRNEAKLNKQISSQDSWIKSLPEGFIKDTMNRGLIPVPTFNEKGMTALTFAKAMAGPLGKPFRIMTNDVVDRARQEMVDKTAQSSGMRFDSKTGKMSMDWNRVAGRGSGQYSDELQSLGGSKGRGKFFNSTFGRFGGYEKNGNIVTDDVYNFNETVGQYAKKSGKALSSGNIGEGLYMAASMAGRFAQDIGWFNQRVLGSEIKVGSLKNVNRKTGRQKSDEEMYGRGVTLYNKPQANTGQSYQSRFARPRNAGVAPVKPPANTPKVTVINSSKKSKPQNSNNQRRTHTPRVSPSHPGSNPNKKILGIF